MPSFNAVNFSTRPSKTIQRQIIFDGLEKLAFKMGLDNPVYVGFGSIWFTDFILAHNRLGVTRMESIESNEIGFSRAEFNRPYSMVNVHRGHSNAVLPELLEDQAIKNRPWLVWLDYDYELNESVIHDIRLLVDTAPANSILLCTISAVGNKYGISKQRPEYIRNLLGAVVPDDLSIKACKDGRLQPTLMDHAMNFMTAVAAGNNRPGGFKPAFKVAYKDGAPMVTVGGALPAPAKSEAVEQLVNLQNWEGFVSDPITAPHLTVREASCIQSLLPSETELTRDQVKVLGFDLSEDEIAVFQKYYKQYPSFAQVVV